MNYLFSLTLTAASILSSCTNGQTQKTDLSANEFSEKIKQLPEALIIDVRTPEEFADGHLINAINIDWRGDDFEKQIATLDKNKPVLVYCLSGGRSSAAADKMRNDSFKEVYELDGGIMKWRVAGLPEARGTAAPEKGMSLQQFNDLLNTDKLVLIDFYAQWCAPCKQMKPYLEEISKEMAATVTVVRIDVDENQQLAKELKIDALPTLLVYKNKKTTWRNVGFASKEKMIEHLK
jgi:thioredoxin 1